eukprot:2799580-Pyramimonas_sp.AAC.1
MIKVVGQVDWDRYENTRSYTDPGRRRADNRLELTLRMLLSGMAGYVKNIRERVGVFTAMKNPSESGKEVEKRRL